MSQTPAGWYKQGDVMRYWDGGAWTEHTQPLTPPAQPSFPMPDAQRRPVKKKRRWPLVLLAGVGVLLIVGVVGAALSGGSPTTSTTGNLAESTSAPGASEEPAAERPDDNPAWGQTVTFDDGSTLTCAKPVKFKRAEFAIGGENAKVLLKSQCTFVNGSDDTFEPGLTTASMTAGDTEGESVYQEGLDAPDNPVRPGKKVTWWVGYGVPSAKDVQLTVSLGFLDYDDVTFSD